MSHLDHTLNDSKCSYSWSVINFHIGQYNVSIYGIHIYFIYSLSGKTPYHQILWSLEGARLDFIITASLWNLTDIPAAIEKV